MGATQREPEAEVALRQALLTLRPRTSFYTAVMLLERLTRGSARIGGDGPLREEAIAFRHDVSFSFQPNDISAIRWVTVEAPPQGRLEGQTQRFEITTTVLGLSGADSPLPLYHVEDLVLDTEPARLQAAFLDVFHSRLTALFYRARSKYSAPREYLRGGRDPLSSRILAAAGVTAAAATEAAATEAATPPSPTRAELLGLAALMATGGGTARSVEASLRRLLAPELGGAPLVLQQFEGSWIDFDPDQRTALGKANSSLALSWILGTRVRHPAHRAKVVVGPLPPDRARAFSPGGAAFERTRRLVQALCTGAVAMELELLIDQDAYPPFLLRAVGGRVLGQDVFLSSRRREGRLLRRMYDLDDHASRQPPAQG